MRTGVMILVTFRKPEEHNGNREHAVVNKKKKKKESRALGVDYK